MYIKSIIIDGFKSYGRRTEVNGFDREFNAITGLNGTGKSNILDSICFVLGISNLSHVNMLHIELVKLLIDNFFRFAPILCKTWFTNPVKPE
jgi:AAA15 family ATPase/GTPase